MFLEKLGNYRTLLPQKQSALRQPAVYDVEVFIAAASGKQDRVFSKGTGCSVTPAVAGKGLIYTVIA